MYSPIALQFQIIVPPHLLTFGFFVGPPFLFGPPLPSPPFPARFFRFCFADISVIVKTDCSFYETKQFSLNSFNQLSALIMS